MGIGRGTVRLIQENVFGDENKHFFPERDEKRGLNTTHYTEKNNI